MKYLIIILASIALFSCKKSVNSDSQNNKFEVIGNWYSIKDNSYLEYYFEKDSMYIFNPYSGDILRYKYFIREDSLFRYFINPEIRNPTFNYYNRILNIDSLQMDFETRSLIRLEDSNTLEMLIKKEIDYKTFYGVINYRKNLAIPLDSLR